jgi:hypothetical protein
MTISNPDPKTVRIVMVVLASAAALAVARALRRTRPRPELVIPEPMDPNDSRGHEAATTASQDGTGVAGVLDRATAAGYTAVFEAEPGAELRCGTCDVVSGATTFERPWQSRLEGASDPDDMAQVSGLVCPACGALGTFVSLFGPGAETDAADVMVALPRPLGDLPIVIR